MAVEFDHRKFAGNIYTAKVLNTLLIVEFSKYYMIDDYQTWSEYSNITGFFTDNKLMN